MGGQANFLPKVVSGARCKVGIVPPSGDVSKPKWIGIFNNVSYGVRYDAVPAYILGRYSAASIDYTAAEVINISAQGYRVVGHGPYKVGGLPMLQKLMQQDFCVFSIQDRATNTEICRISNVLPIGFDTQISAKQLEEMTFAYIGILHDDEETLANQGTAETPGALTIDDPT